MEKLNLHSPDFIEANIAKLAELFPSCVTETRDANGTLRKAIDFDQLRQELSTSVVDGPQERYQINWPGKREALLTANAPITKTLRPCRVESVSFDTTQNLFIEGDNLDALRLLQETYLGKVKMIYIDPPYNTGNDFIYHDKFNIDKNLFDVQSGVKDEEGNRLTDQDPHKQNSESNGRFHSDWLSMMYPRLKLARNLLKQDGAIFVSCDEGEQARLRMVMDEIFGQANFVADLVWAAGRKNDSRLISVSHEYIVCYSRDAEYLKEKKILWRQKKKGINDIYVQYNKLKRECGNDYEVMTSGLKAWYRDLADGNPAKAHKHYCQIDSRGVYFSADISWPGGGGPKYEVIHPITKLPVKVPSRGWITPDPKKMQDWIVDDRVHFGSDEKSVPCLKKYLRDSEFQTPYSVFYQDGRAASKRLRELMGADYFNFPKDEWILQELVGMMTSAEEIIVDLFAGSSTTGHSVMAQNAVDGGSRKFIMVQLPEVCDPKSEAYKAGYKSIAEIGKERIRRAGKKIKAENADKKGIDQLDIGFRVLKIDSSNMKDVYYTPDAVQQGNLFDQIDNIREDRTPEDLLFQVLLDWGVDLTLPITQETIAGKTVLFVDDNALAACFDEDINEAFVKELAARHPLRVVFCDAGFISDSVKINIEQIFKLISPTTEIKVI
jgi:adenine-specific DNA-methyltransferase